MMLLIKLSWKDFLASNGMASFSDVLSEEEVENIHHYVRARAHEDREVALGKYGSSSVYLVRTGRINYWSWISVLGGSSGGGTSTNSNEGLLVPHHPPVRHKD